MRLYILSFERTTKPALGEWTEMALTVMFITAAVLFVSFLAVVTGLA